MRGVSAQFIFAILSSWLLTFFCGYYLYQHIGTIKNQSEATLGDLIKQSREWILELKKTGKSVISLKEKDLAIDQQTSEMRLGLERLDKRIQEILSHDESNRTQESTSKPIRIVVHPGHRVYMPQFYPDVVPGCEVGCTFQTGESGPPSSDEVLGADAIIWYQSGPTSSSGQIVKDYPEKIRIIYHVESETSIHPGLREDYLDLGNFYDILLSYHLNEDQVIRHRRSLGYIFSSFTASYALDQLSDYYKPVTIPFAEKLGDVNKQTFKALGATFVSNCKDEASGRNKLMQELHDHGFAINSFGKCGPNPRNMTDFPECVSAAFSISKPCIQKYYKFALAFENSIDESYVSEKMYQGLLSGTIPVYLGAPNVEKFLPTYKSKMKSIIDASDFATSRDLAQFLLQVANNETLYNEYLKWKDTSPSASFADIIKKDMQKRYTLCDLCKKVGELKSLGARYLTYKRKQGPE